MCGPWFFLLKCYICRNLWCDLSVVQSKYRSTSAGEQRCCAVPTLPSQQGSSVFLGGSKGWMRPQTTFTLSVSPLPVLLSGSLPQINLRLCGSGGAARCATAPWRSEFQQELLELCLISGEGNFPEWSCSTTGVKIFHFREHASKREGMVKGWL